jgi:hypothetical protein
MASWNIKQLPPPKGIVCRPVSTNNPNGFGDKPNQFVKFDYTNTAKPSGTYELNAADDYQLQTDVLATNGPSIYIDTSNQTYVRREIGDELSGGNCYWSRALDKTAILMV